MNRILNFILLTSSILISGCSDSSQQSSIADKPLKPLASDEPEAPALTTQTESKNMVYGDKFPEVLAVKVDPGNGESMRFAVTLSSAYDSPQRYADAWRVLDGDDEELGIRILGHDHASEQPFTRSGTIEIPDGTSTVYVEGRDQANGCLLYTSPSPRDRG